MKKRKTQSVPGGAAVRVQRPCSAKHEDLKAFAAARCCDIARDFDAQAIKTQPASVRAAWEIGQRIISPNDQALPHGGAKETHE